MANRKTTPKLVEIARSFSYKLSLPNYQNADFFCSQKVEVPEDQAEKKSEELYLFCRGEVAKSVTLFKEELRTTTPSKVDGNKDGGKQSFDIPLKK